MYLPLRGGRCSVAVAVVAATGVAATVAAAAGSTGNVATATAAAIGVAACHVAAAAIAAGVGDKIGKGNAEDVTAAVAAAVTGIACHKIFLQEKCRGSFLPRHFMPSCADVSLQPVKYQGIGLIQWLHGMRRPKDGRGLSDYILQIRHRALDRRYFTVFHFVYGRFFLLVHFLHLFHSI